MRLTRPNGGLGSIGYSLIDLVSELPRSRPISNRETRPLADFSPPGIVGYRNARQFAGMKPVPRSRLAARPPKPGSTEVAKNPHTSLLRNMKKLLKKFVRDERGLETVEYAIIVGLIVGGLVLVIAAIGVWVNGQFTQLQTDLGA